MIYLFGDLHGSENILQFDKETFSIGKTLTKDDYVIILGDFGIPWARFDSANYYREMKRLKYLSDKSWTTLFIDGNHENFENLEMFEKVNKFGSTVQQLEENIFHLLRGNIYNINDKNFFVMGGALSIDKNNRIPRVSWWKEEQPSKKELDHGLDNLKKNNNKVDYILTHTCSNKITEEVLKSSLQSLFIHDPLSKYFDVIDKKISYKRWFFGHFHIDIEISDKYYCLYKTYYQLDCSTNEVKVVGGI